MTKINYNKRKSNLIDNEVRRPQRRVSIGSTVTNKVSGQTGRVVTIERQSGVISFEVKLAGGYHQWWISTEVIGVSE